MNRPITEPLQVEDFVAGPARSPSFLTHARARKKSTLVANIRHFSRVLDLDLDELSDKYEGLDISRRWRPELYWCAHRLCLGLATGDITGAADVLIRLQTLGLERVYSDAFDLRSLFDEAWDHQWARGARSAAERRGRRMSLRSLPGAAFARRREQLMRARAQLAEVDPELFAEHEEHCAEITIFGDSAPSTQNVATAFGLIAFGFTPTDELSEGFLLGQLAHEAGHMRLSSMMETETLFVDDGRPRYRLSARPDLRPMEAVFHAAFVYARTIRVLERAVDCFPREGSFQRKLEETIPAFRRAYTFVREEAELTPQGRHLVDDVPRVFTSRWGACVAEERGCA